MPGTFWSPTLYAQAHFQNEGLDCGYCLGTFSGVLLGHVDTFSGVLCVDTLSLVFLSHVDIMWIHFLGFY